MQREKPEKAVGATGGGAVQWPNTARRGESDNVILEILSVSRNYTMCRKSLTNMALALLCISVLTGQGCPGPADGDGGGSSTQALLLFNEAWDAFDQNYSYFEYKGVDWDEVWFEWESEFDADLTDDQCADRLIEMLGVLEDWHVSVKRPDGTWAQTTPEDYESNYTSSPRNRYTLDGAGYEMVGDIIWHAWLTGDIAYIRVDSLESQYDSVFQNQIGDLFVTYENAAGMIIDIRPNNGGNEENAKEIASRFAAAGTTYGYTENRIPGSFPAAFEDAVPHTLEPSSKMHYTGPVVCLIGPRCMSSAEWFALMMRDVNAVLIGARTRGASGFPREISLSNGMAVNVPRWIAYQYDYWLEEWICIEDIGVEPDVAVSTEESFDDSRDYVVEAALSELGVRAD